MVPARADVGERALGAGMRIAEFEVIHGELSPDNVVLRDDGRRLLLDFGSARFMIAHAGADSGQTPSGGPLARPDLPARSGRSSPSAFGRGCVKTRTHAA